MKPALSPLLRARCGIVIALVYLAIAASMIGPLDDSLSPDTSGYLLFSQHRQPLYGLWANAVHSLLQSWSAVKAVQVSLFLAFSTWVLIELALVSRLGIVSASLLTAVLLVLAKLGFLNLVGSIISEGLFLPMIALTVGLFLAWVRAGGTVILAGVAIVLVMMTQLRTAALLVAMVPLAAAAVVLMHGWSKSRLDIRSGVVIAAVVTGLAGLPAILGKSFLQVGTKADSIGFVLLPRVALLPPPQAVGDAGPRWAEMSATWREAASHLSAAALTQFDAQLQEAVRYDLAPNVLLPSLTGRTREQARNEWETGHSYPHARRIAVGWIVQQWPTYLRLSAAHMWGMLTMANYIGDAERARVWDALNSVSPHTWREAPLRRDHPLVHIDQPLKWSTSALYRFFRYSAMATLLLGVIGAVRVLLRLRQGRTPHQGDLVVAFAAAWVVAHSTPAALAYAPEARYTLPNLFVLLSGAAAWFAYLDVGGATAGGVAGSSARR